MRDRKPQGGGEAVMVGGQALPVIVREYHDKDERDVVALLEAAFGGWPRGVAGGGALELFRWKHLANPLGRSVMVVAEHDGAIVGFLAWVRWRVGTARQSFEAPRGADLAVAVEHRGRGIHQALARAGDQLLPTDAAFVLSSPNELSRRGTERLGGRRLERLPLFVFAPNPLRTGIRALGPRSGCAFDREAVAAGAAVDVLAPKTDELDDLLSAVRRSPNRFSTERDAGFIRWRYAAPGAYHAICEHRAGRLIGVAVFRVGSRRGLLVTRLCELIVTDGEFSIARRLLARVIRAAPAHYVTCHFPAGSTARRAVLGRGFLPLRSLAQPAVRMLDGPVTPDPTRAAAWSLSLGDFDLL